MAPCRIAIIGFGKIAHDQHVPVIAANPAFILAGVSSQRGLTLPGVPGFRSPEEMYAALPDLDAVAICTPPEARTRFALEALAAGKHVLLEKPPAATLSEVEALRAAATAAGRSLFATWHSRFNAAVEEARSRLAGKTLQRLHIEWKEDVRRWHPGQDWIWQAGGFGVFDPGINALSIVTRIMPAPLFVARADLSFPDNSETPIAADIAFASPAGTPDAALTAAFDWRQEGPQTWSITIETGEGTRLDLTEGGTRLAVDGVEAVAAPSQEYERIYERWAGLLAAGASDVDETPLRLVADAFLVGRRVVVDPFHW